MKINGILRPRKLRPHAKRWYAGIANLDPGSGDQVVVFVWETDSAAKDIHFDDDDDGDGDTDSNHTFLLGILFNHLETEEVVRGGDECIESLMETLFQVSDRYVKIARKSLIR